MATYSAVLMGDIVGSEHVASTAELHARFNEVVNHHNEVNAAMLASPLTITLGDEFQGLARSLVSAAHLAREIRHDLMAHSIDCRFAIGAVHLETPLNTEKAWNMMGPGFASTRAKLNDKRASNRYRFDVIGHPLLEIMLEASGATLTVIEQSWTDTQRSDIRALLDGSTPREVARLRNVSVHNIYKVRTSGNFALYMTQWNAINEALSTLDELFTTERTEECSMV
ncbi:SatD family protein [Rhizobium sp. SAFR-030]|uniref:SatD family protein n=1 Tax=Rhizobium sp. SAFR-030 TaxID=3387277 RepID=UPI003F80C741